MTNFEKIKSMSQEELIKFLSENSSIDESVWLKYFNEKYCDNCDAIESTYRELGLTPLIRELDDKCVCAYCEVKKDCRFFPGKFNDGCPSDEDILKIWLEAEVNES